VGAITSRLEARGLKLVGMKLVQVDREMAERHYSAHQGKPFFPGLVEFITASPVVAMVLQGRAVVASVRESVGATDPATAAPGSIRGDFGLDISRNLVHASDSDEAAAREVFEAARVRLTEAVDRATALDNEPDETGGA